MKITAAFVPHEDFHKGTWLCSTGDSLWYYFMPGKSANTISNKEFWSTVDEPLRPLTRFLHHRGIRTTPSCSGHFRGKGHFYRVYSSLLRDEARIRNSGLLLRDVESGKEYFFQDKRHRLPFRRQEFVHTGLQNQQKGIIGIHAGNPVFRQELLNLSIPEVKVNEKDRVVFISTESENKRANIRTWAQVTDRVIRTLLAAGC